MGPSLGSLERLWECIGLIMTCSKTHLLLYLVLHYSFSGHGKFLSEKKNHKFNAPYILFQPMQLEERTLQRPF